MTSYKITAVDVRDFKRVSEVRIEPDGDAHVLLIAGKNMAGKSSVLDALDAALGGKDALPTDPVRHGAERSAITVELNGGTYKITRTVTPDGGGKLEITGPDGPIRAPQAWLDKIVGARFLDPLAFLSAPAKDQRRTLMALAGLNLDTIDAERSVAFTERTEIGRDIARAEGELARLPEPGPPPAPARAMNEITRDIQVAAGVQRTVDAARECLAIIRRDREAVEARVGALRAQVDALRAQLERLASQEVEAFKVCAETGSVDIEEQAKAKLIELRAEAARAETAARWQAGAEQINHRRRDAEDVARLARGRRDHFTEIIDRCDLRKAKALAAASMPVDGLGFTEDGITLGGVPFTQASQAERLRCALAIAMRLSPNLRDVWVRDGSLLDDDGLEILRELAEQIGCRVWIERVGERDAGAIIIRDGRVMPAPF